MSLMSRSLQFVLALSFVSFSIGAWAAGAAKVDFAVGQVDAVTANGLSRTLVKGDPVASGETVRTGSGARAQLRFNDGGMVSLQPNTDSVLMTTISLVRTILRSEGFSVSCGVACVQSQVWLGELTRTTTR